MSGRPKLAHLTTLIGQLNSLAPADGAQREFADETARELAALLNYVAEQENKGRTPAIGQEELVREIKQRRSDAKEAHDMQPSEYQAGIIRAYTRTLRMLGAEKNNSKEESK